MARVIVVVALLTLATAITEPNAQSSNDEPDAFDVEPPLLKQNLSADVRRERPTQEADIANLEKQFDRAKRNADGAERLYKIGVLSKMEVEQRLLRATRCEAALANARVARAKEDLAMQQSQVPTDQSSEKELHAAKAVLAQLTEAAQLASAKCAQAELAAAEANLQRQQKLLKLGSARKSDVERAEQRLAEL